MLVMQPQPGGSVCVLTQQLQRSALIHVTLLQSGHVVDGVLHHQFQVRQFILQWEKKTETHQMANVLQHTSVRTRSPGQLSAAT